MQSTIKILRGDITQIPAEAIVNAANTSLLGGGGVDGAIHRAGGPKILEECRMIRNRQGGCKVGEAVATTAGNLPAKYVIHTVGPVWNGGKSDEETLLANAYLNSLQLGMQLSIASISFPNISTGIYRFPKLLAAEIAWQTVTAFLKNSSSLQTVSFVCFDAENELIYKELAVKSGWEDGDITPG